MKRKTQKLVGSQSQFKRELQSLHRVNQCCSLHSRAASFENVIFGKVLRRFLRKSGTKRSFNQVCRSSPLANKNVPSVHCSLVSSHLSYFVRCCQMIQNESESEKMFSVVPRPSSLQDVIAENICNKKPWWSFIGLVAHQWWIFVVHCGSSKKPCQTETGPSLGFFLLVLRNCYFQSRQCQM